MKYVNQLSKEGKITTRPNEDREKGERQILKDTSLYQAAVCLQCEKKKCIGTDRCFGREAEKRDRRK